MKCPICLEHKTESSTVVELIDCRHLFCRDCMEQWLLKLETNRVDPQDLSCPQCRSVLNKKDIFSILGHHLELTTPLPSSPSSNGLASGDASTAVEEQQQQQPDEFTRAYLETLQARGEAQQCPGCKIYIVKVEGCDNMKCRCGARFCFCCGEVAPVCSGGGIFFDNVRGEEEEFSYYDDEGSDEDDSDEDDDDDADDDDDDDDDDEDDDNESSRESFEVNPVVTTTTRRPRRVANLIQFWEGVVHNFTRSSR